MANSEESTEPNEFGRTHREIADLLGIGRARVFYLEHQALSKIKTAFAEAGVNSLFELSEAPRFDVEIKDETPASVEKFSPQHGWLKVDAIVSINKGSEEIEDVVRA